MHPHNCLIMGSGRSGTSMVAGLVAAAGYFMGDHLIPPRCSNPKGFFEDDEVNGVNEALLEPVIPARPRYVGRWVFPSRPADGQRWLAQLPLDVALVPPPAVEARMRALIARRPYCFKDPRFCYTLPAWRPLLGDTVFVCVFRDPAVTVASILKECEDVASLHHLHMDRDRAIVTWTLMYRHILERHRFDGRWLFLHYDRVLAGESLDCLERFLGAPLDRSFPDARYRRSRPAGEVPREARQIYAELCLLADAPSAEA